MIRIRTKKSKFLEFWSRLCSSAALLATLSWLTQ